MDAEIGYQGNIYGLRLVYLDRSTKDVAKVWLGIDAAAPEELKAHLRQTLADLLNAGHDSSRQVPSDFRPHGWDHVEIACFTNPWQISTDTLGAKFQEKLSEQGYQVAENIYIEDSKRPGRIVGMEPGLRR